MGVKKWSYFDFCKAHLLFQLGRRVDLSPLDFLANYFIGVIAFSLRMKGVKGAGASQLDIDTMQAPRYGHIHSISPNGFPLDYPTFFALETYNAIFGSKRSFFPRKNEQCFYNTCYFECAFYQQPTLCYAIFFKGKFIKPISLIYFFILMKVLCSISIKMGLDRAF